MPSPAFSEIFNASGIPPQTLKAFRACIRTPDGIPAFIRSNPENAVRVFDKLLETDHRREVAFALAADKAVSTLALHGKPDDTVRLLDALTPRQREKAVTRGEDALSALEFCDKIKDIRRWDAEIDALEKAKASGPANLGR